MFDPETGQAKIYKVAIAPIVEEVLEGFNCTIFAYGQTGTGKTYTMEVSLQSSASLSPPRLFVSALGVRSWTDSHEGIFPRLCDR